MLSIAQTISVKGVVRIVLHTDARKMKDFEKQKTKHQVCLLWEGLVKIRVATLTLRLPPLLQAELEELGKAEARSKVAKFLSSETSIVNKPVNPFSQSDEKQQAGMCL